MNFYDFSTINIEEENEIEPVNIVEVIIHFFFKCIGKYYVSLSLDFGVRK